MGKPTAVLIEGLFSFLIGFVRRQYKAKLEAMGYEVKSLPWTAKIPAADVIIGHSFGGGSAVKNCPPCKLLITFDARRLDWWNNDNMAKPKNAKKHMNFFQMKGLNGNEIKGAENFWLPSSNHGNIVANTKAHTLIDEALNKL